ncbi:MAG: HlyC/CorC family transporter [Synechococcaceae cyanobacterium SM2_3_60]|nr:HlyC/CorC family transporter [Synechococcaceae cyanobacterium SM2_3_60]
MDEPPSSWIPVSDDPLRDLVTRLLWVLLLLVINALFVAAEFSLVSVRRSRIVQLASEGNRSAQAVQRAQEQLRQFLSTMQACITMASLAMGWIGASQLAPVFAILLAQLPWALPVGSANLLVFLGLVYLQVLVGELIPKTLAIIYAEQTALSLMGVTSQLRWWLRPLVLLLDGSANLILRALRVPIPDSATLFNAVTAEELQLLIAATGESGSLEAEERELLTNVFEFGETVASEVMIPRTSIDAINETATVQDVLLAVADSGHSRYLVIGESLDDIRGLVHVKEVVAALGRGELSIETAINSFIRPAHFEYESKRVGELLSEMQQQHRAMVVIVDEFGGTAGLITIRDLVEEIVGRISDEVDADDEPDFQVVDERTTIIQAQVDLDDVNEKLLLALPIQDDYQTLGGFVIYQMQKIPQVGERFVYDNIEFTVMGIDGPRLDRIKMHILEPVATTES